MRRSMVCLVTASMLSAPLLAAAAPAPMGARAYLWDAFPSDQKVRLWLGRRVSSDTISMTPKQFQRQWKPGRCTPRFALSSEQGIMRDYVIYKATTATGDSADVSVMEYPDPAAARSAVVDFRSQAHRCPRYGMIPKHVSNPEPFPVRILSVHGSGGQAKVKYRYSDVAYTSDRTWVTARDRFAVQVTVTSYHLGTWGKFPTPRTTRLFTEYALQHLSTNQESQR